MAALSNDIKAFVVQSLACFDSPSTVVAQVKQEFSFDVSIQQVSAYDPTKVAGQRLSQKWVDLFNSTRERFQKELSDIPIANKAYRLRALNRMAMKTENMRNFNLTAQLIEQAAKECGDSYTNKQKLEHTGANGGAVEVITLNKEEYKKARQEMLEDDDC